MTEAKKKTKERRRPDQATMIEIKKAQDAEREEILAKAPPKPAAEVANNSISYDQWWMIVNRKIKLRPWLKSVIFADFKARGAGKIETEKRYNELLGIFGYHV